MKFERAKQRNKPKCELDDPFLKYSVLIHEKKFSKFSVFFHHSPLLSISFGVGYVNWKGTGLHPISQPTEVKGYSTLPPAHTYILKVVNE